MELKQYGELAKTTLAKTEGEYEHLTALHMVMGMTTEVGELVDVFKKNMAYGKPIDWVNVNEEIGDLMWYIVNFCSEYDIDLETVLDTNIAKLQKRFPDKVFVSEHAINRNIEEERDILEKNNKTV